MWSVVFSPDSQRIASGSVEGDVHIWAADTGTLVYSLPTLGTSNFLLSFSPDSKRLALSPGGDIIKIWDIGAERYLPTFEAAYHSGVRSISYSVDGQRLASCSIHGDFQIWNSETGVSLLGIQGHGDSVTTIVFSPDGQRLATASADKTIKVWAADTGILLGILKGNSMGVTSAIFSPDGQRILSSSRDMTIKIWDSETAVCLETLQHPYHVILR